MTTPRMTKSRRLEAAGYECLKDLWVPKAFAARAKAQAEMHLEDVKRIEQQSRPRGRPKKQPA